MIRRPVKLLIVLFLLSVLPCSSLALTKLEQKFTDSFPSVLSGWERGKTVNYEAQTPGLGIGFGYGKPGAVATLYMYNLNYKTIPAGVSSKIIKEQYSGCKSDIYALQKMGYYENVTLRDEGTMTIGYAKKTVFLYSKYDIKSNDVDTNSWLFLAPYKNHFFKVRLTYEKGQLSESDVRTFMNNVMDLVYLL